MHLTKYNIDDDILMSKKIKVTKVQKLMCTDTASVMLFITAYIIYYF